MRIARGRDRAGHDRMCDDPFQKKLRPRFAIELHCPIRQRFPAHAIEQIAAAEGPTHNHSYPAIFRHRKTRFSALRSMRESLICTKFTFSYSKMLATSAWLPSV